MATTGTTAATSAASSAGEIVSSTWRCIASLTRPRSPGLDSAAGAGAATFGMIDSDDAATTGSGSANMFAACASDTGEFDAIKSEVSIGNVCTDVSSDAGVASATTGV